MSDKQEEKNQSAREYVAFISYRHKDLDKYVARRVHTLIERYIVPKELRAEHGKKLGLVFRDEEELPVSSDLTDSIQTALDHSRFLIVICTPNTPESIWVEREISYFLEHHSRDQVVGILVDGTPEESFPKLLTTVYDKDGVTPIGTVEPLAANLTGVDHRFRKSRIRKEAVRLYAALMGVPFDSLWQREKRYKMRSAVALMALVLTVALSFSVSIFLKNREITARNEMIEAQNIQIQNQNAEIKSQYEEIQNKNADLKRREAEALIRSGELQYERGDMQGAISSAVQAVSTQEGRESSEAEAEYLLYRALGAGRYENGLRTVGVIEQEEDIEGMLLSRDGVRLYTLGSRGYIRCFSTEDGGLLWLGDSLSRGYHYDVAARQRMYILEEAGLLLCCRDDCITVLDLKDGSLVWNHIPAKGSGVDFACLSPDQKTLAVIDTVGDYFSTDNQLILLDVTNGEMLQEIDLPEELKSDRLIAYGRENGAFSEDGRYLAAMLYKGRYATDGRTAYVFLTDLQEGTVRILRQEDVQGYLSSPFVIGLLCHSESESVLAMFYDLDQEAVRMDEIFFSGEIGENSSVPISLPERGMVNPYASTFVPGENNALMASCMGMAFLYRVDNGRLVSNSQSTADSILVRSWINQDTFSYSYLAGDGNLYAWYGSGGFSMGPFSAQRHLSQLVITENYAQSNGGYGFQMDENVVEVVVCDDNPRMAYIQKQAKDPGIYTPDWVGSVSGKHASYYTLRSFGEEKLLLMEDMKDETAKVRFVDVEEQKITKTLDITLKDLGTYTSFYNIRDALFWKDEEHFSYTAGRTYYVYDMKANTVRTLFEEYKNALAAGTACLLENGEVLHAAVAYAKGADWEDPASILLWQIGDGDVREFACDEGERWIGRGDAYQKTHLWAGSAGYVLVARYGEDGGRRSGFSAYDVAGGKKYVIPDRSPAEDEGSVTMGKSKPVFAVRDEDGRIRIYDILSQNLKCEIRPEAGQSVGGITFCMEDEALAIYTLDGRLFVYDADTGNCLSECEMGDAQNILTNEVELTCFEDPARHRLFFTVPDKGGVCLDTIHWKKTMILYGEVDAYCAKTNEMYRLNREGTLSEKDPDLILCQPALTLDELVKAAEIRSSDK